MSELDYTMQHLPPPGDAISLYNATQLPTLQTSTAIPQIFLDAMTIRETVFCQEQHCELANELDLDDPRSHHWVLYSSAKSSTATPAPRMIPIGVIRLVPPPHAPHHGTAAVASDGDDGELQVGGEPFIKFGRLAVLPAYRKGGFAGRLLVAAMEFARDQAGLFKDESGKEWRGRVLVHAQARLERYYAKFGFKKDVGMGVFDEEGIDHIGMWKTLELGV